MLRNESRFFNRPWPGWIVWPLRLLALVLLPFALGILRWTLDLGLLWAFIVLLASMGAFVALHRRLGVHHAISCGLADAGILWWLVFLFVSPGAIREYRVEQTRMPSARIEDDGRILLQNLRSFRWTSEETPERSWYDLEVHADSIISIDYFLVYFSDVQAVAHSFLSFGFANGEHVAISIEARRRRDEPYALLPGIFKRFELMYVLGDEPDLVGIRLHTQRDPIYRLPITTPKVKMRGLFLNMLQSANKLSEQAAFYNALTSTCTTVLAEEINLLREDPVPLWHWRLLLPGYSGELARELGLVESDTPILESLEDWRIHPETVQSVERIAFSRELREKE